MSSPPDGATPAAPVPSAEPAGQSPAPTAPETPPGASETTPPGVPDGSPPSSGATPADNVSELVRVAKAERRAAQATKVADERAKALAGVEAKQATFNGLVADGKLLDAARVYFPDDAMLAQKLFWQLNDYVLSLPDDQTKPVELSIEERTAKIVEEKLAAEKKAALDKAAADKSAEAQKADQQLEQERAKYFDSARQALASNPNAYPLVAAKIIAGTMSQAHIIGHAEAIAAEVFKLPGLTYEQKLERAAAETDPELVFAAMETVLRGDTAAPAAAASADQTLEQITAAAIAAAERGRPMVTISSAAVRGAPPVLAKKPEEMSLDELNAWAIAEATRRRGAPAAG